jgi:ABC-type sugar transport system ATPase subunit
VHEPCPDLDEPLLALRGITRSYPGVRALDGVDLDVRAGEIHGLLGQNGAGKSTLIKIISGAERPDSGSLRLNGVEQRFRSPHDAQFAGIATIYQELSLVPQLSAAENVYLSDLPRRRWGPVDWRAVRRSAAEALESVGFSFDPGRPAGSLSIAEQQGIEIAKALHRGARVILLDEPTATLPAPDVRAFFGLLQRLKARGVGLIFISHRLDEVYEVCDRLTILRDGRRVRTASTTELDAAGTVQAMVGRPGMAMPPTSPAARPAPVAVPDEPVRRRFGPGRRTDAEAPAFAVEALSDTGQLQDVSLAVWPGEAVGVAGLVGSGLSELAACLFGIRRRTAGRMHARGRAVDINSPRQAIRARLGLIPEDRKGQGLVLGMDVACNVSMASLDRVSRLSVISGRQEKRAAQRAADQLKIKIAGTEQRVGTLSGGNQQKVVLAKWIAADVEVLILHEPTRGVDVAAKEEIYTAIAEFLARGGSAILISSEVEETAMCDRVYVLNHGAVAAHLDDHEVDSDRIVATLR